MSWIAKASGLSDTLAFATLLLAVLFWRFISVGDYEKAMLVFTLWFCISVALSALETLNEEAWKRLFNG